MLRSISIDFGGGWLLEKESFKACNCFMPLGRFRNLISFELYNFYGKERLLLKEIAGVLARSPFLKTLGLALAVDCDCEEFPESVILPMYKKNNFLEKLCLTYESKYKARPLQLETLRLGTGLYILESETSGTGNFLAKLVQLSNLQRLHIFNNFIKYGGPDGYREELLIHWYVMLRCS
jgi:hypothetical protein